MKAVAKKLDDAGIRYAVVGGLAAAIHGQVRMTTDVDMKIECDPLSEAEVRSVIKLFSDDQFAPFVADPEELAKLSHLIPVKHKASGTKIDLMLAVSDYDRQLFDRLTVEEADGFPIRYVDVENLIILKILAWRGRDIDDIQMIILKNSDLDEKYIRRWLKEFEELFEERLIQRWEQVKKDAES